MSRLVSPRCSLASFQKLRSDDLVGLTNVLTRGVDGRQVNSLPEVVSDSLTRLQKLLPNSDHPGACANTEGLPQYAV